jgi:quercetin dioxygenase-like cupin family protein
VTTTATAQPLWFLDNLARILLSGDESDGRLGVVEITTPPGGEPPLHVHHDHDECFYVLEGEVTLFIGGGTERTLGAGEFALAPRGVPHTYRAGEAGARVLVSSIPAGFEAFVEKMSVPADGPAPPEPARPERLAAVAAQHGIEILGPPGARP